MNYQRVSNTQITKNALLLYIRTFITIFISVYTSRILLIKLGTDDFGIFSVVGGIAILFTFLGSSFFTATQRFLNFALINGTLTEYKKTFTTTFQCYAALSIIIFILGETIGLYIVNHVLNISIERMTAANYVYQFALLAIVIGLTNSPYKASILAHEEYSYYAYTDIIIKILRLAIVYMIGISDWDKLITYSALYLSVSILNFIIDQVYCRIKFKGCRIIKCWDKQQFFKITKFSSISLLKKSAETCTNQGNNTLINIYGGLAASASYGLSNQIWGTLTGFFLNIQTAYNTQINKSYAAADFKQFNKLIIDSSRFSSYVVTLMAIPLVLNMPLVLQIWLKDVPQYAIPFCIAVIFSCYFSAISNSLNTAIIAVGNIKRHQTVTSIMYFMTIPIALILLHIGMSLTGVYVIKIICQVAEIIYSAKYLSMFVDFDIKSFAKGSLLSCLFLFSSLLLPILVMTFTDMNVFLTAIVNTIIGETVFALAVWKWGLSKSQRERLGKYIKTKLGIKITNKASF